MKMRKKSSDSLEPARRAYIYTRETGQKGTERGSAKKEGERLPCLGRAERCGGEQRETVERGEGGI